LLLSRSRLAFAGAVAALAVLPSPASAQRTVDACPDDAAKVSNWSYDITRSNGTKVNDVPRLAGNVRKGDTITASFDLAPNCIGKSVTLASYRSVSLSGVPLSSQVLFSYETKQFTNDSTTAKRRFENALTAKVFGSSSTTNSGGKNDCQDQTPNTKNKGANTSGPYDPACDGSASENGNGGGKATGRPCAGCVGNADDKNPPGQQPGPQDRNNGYECDGNKGIAKGNPAHSKCNPLPYFQVDFATGPVIRNLSLTNMYGPDLIDFVNGPEVQ
jgi:hypothetical protein